jgi:hypothetical protein
MSRKLSMLWDKANANKMFLSNLKRGTKLEDLGVAVSFIF